MPVTQQLVSGLKAIVSSSLAPNTWKLYNRAWTVLQDFGRTVHISVFPLESYNLGLFISYLFQKGYSTATIRTFVSAIGFYHKVNGLHDPSSSYMIEKAIQGLKKLRPSIDKRRAITIDMLANMVCSLFNLPLTMYERYLFKSMFLIAFFGLPVSPPSSQSIIFSPPGGTQFQSTTVPVFLPPSSQDLPSQSGTNNNSLLCFHSSPLDAAVDLKLKQKIWSNSYLDFALLLREHSEDQPPGHQMGLEKQDAQSVYLSVSKKKDLTYNQWLKAFFMFATVYTQKFPNDYCHLLKYADTIRELYASGAQWHTYDEMFRRSRESTLWPWQTLQMELWGKAMAVFRSVGKESSPSITNRQYSFRQPGRSHPNFRPQGYVSPSNSAKFRPKGFCWAFHQGESCSGKCGFSHKCYKCDRGVHRATQCFGTQTANHTEAPTQHKRPYNKFPNSSRN